jgi:hypothetical protein
VSRFAIDPPPRDLSDHYDGESCPRCGVETLDGSLCWKCRDADEYDRADSIDSDWAAQ